MKNLIFLLTWLRLLTTFAAPPTTGQFLFQQKPETGAFLPFGVTPVTNQAFGWDGTKVVMLAPSGGVSWGGITGTLSAQTDLQSALNAKQALTGTLALAGFGSITGTLPVGNLPGNVQLTGGVLALGGFSSITGTLADARLSANVQLKDGTLALAGFGSISGTLPTANLPTIPNGNLSANVQLKDGTLALNGFGSVTGTLAAARIADLSATYLTVTTAASTYQPLDADLTAIAALSGTNTIYYRSAANTWTAVSIGSGLAFSGGSLSATNSGTVTSVALTVPSFLSVAGSPITSSGTLAVSLETQSAHTTLIGPTSGSAATPTFRLLVAGDVPDLSATYLTTTAATAGYQPLDGDLTALAALSGTNNLYYRSAANTWSTVSFGAGLSFSGGALSSSVAGTVTSVGLSAPGIFSVSGSPVISSGTIALSLATQSANLVWAGPLTGSAATPTFRALVTADIPDLSGVYLTTSAAASGYQPLDADLTAIAALSGTNNIYYRSAANTWSSVAVGTGLDFTTGTLSSTATVSSVALTVPAIFSVSGSPVTSSGTLAVSLATQTAHTIWAGPTSGSAATPAFRALVAADVPDVSGTYLTVTAAAAAYQPLDGDLTALAALSGTNDIYYRSASNTWTNVVIGTGLGFSGGTLTATGTGTVSSVALTLPAIFSVTGSPVTTTGTLAATLANQSAHLVLAGPTTGSATTPTFRALVAADIPDISATYQPLDADLTAIAALSGTNNIYYRSAANTWSSVTVGTGLDFTTGTLSLPDTAVTPGSYTATNITVDAKGRITAAANGGPFAALSTNTFTGPQIMSVDGASSTPAVKLTGAWFSGGTSTTTKPQLLIEETGANSISWSASGTGLGVNSGSSFAGNLIDAQMDGTSVFAVFANGSGRIAGNFTVFGALVATNGIVGTTAVGNAIAGNVGEFASSYVALAGSPVALVTATSANVTSISLTAGDWDVEGNINFSGTIATITSKRGAISVTSATMPTDGSEVWNGQQTTVATFVDGVAIPRKRVNVSSTTTVYLVGQASFSAGAVSASGGITARRVR